ncbi:MAG: ABC transporter permease [Anaerolineae bacterium]|nr:ABC transporter permease [Anaerolineae bacterium]
MATQSHSGAAALSTSSPRAERAKSLVLLVSRVWAWVFLIGLVAFFTLSVSAATNGDVNFLSLANSQNVLMSITPILLMGLGQTFVIIAAGIDLSVGWVMGLSSVIAALAMRDLIAAAGTPTKMGDAAINLAAIALGLVCAFIIDRAIKRGLPSATLSGAVGALIRLLAALGVTALTAWAGVALIRAVLARSGIHGPLALVAGVLFGVLAFAIANRFVRKAPDEAEGFAQAAPLLIRFAIGVVAGVAVTFLLSEVLAQTGMTEPVVILVGFTAGACSTLIPGFINGVIIARLRIPPFIVTLGMSFVARGVAFLLSGGNVVGQQPEGVRNFGNEALLYVVTRGEGGFYFLNKPEISGEALRGMVRVFQWPVVVAFIVLIIAAFILHRTQYGRHTYAIGGNREAALRAGVPVTRHTILLYVASAFTAGLAGVLHTARFSGGSSIAGDPLLMSSIAAVIVGGVSMFGGTGSVIGTLIGALIISVLTTGLVMLNVEPFYQFVVVGIVVILAVIIDQARDIIVGRMEAERG